MRNILIAAAALGGLTAAADCCAPKSSSACHAQAPAATCCAKASAPCCAMTAQRDAGKSVATCCAKATASCYATTAPCDTGKPTAKAVADFGALDFRHTFVEPPKVGDVILKLVVNDPRRATLKAFAEYDMPSMRGHHASGRVAFRRNKAGDFVIPIHFAMRGDWEIVLTFEEADGTPVARRTVRLDI